MEIEVSLTPELYAHRTLVAEHTTVAIDLLRATTSICAAFQSGCEAVLPLCTLEGIEGYRAQGYRIAAERGGCRVGEAEYDNSPTGYLREDLHGIRIAYSTTNGTVSILRAADAKQVLVGSFANISALCNRLRQQGNSVVLLCSGWEGDFCMEDALVAGAIIDRLCDLATLRGDAARMAHTLWQQAKQNPRAYCEQASHVARLQRLGAEDDVDFAFLMDTCPVVPRLENNLLVL